MQLLSSMAAFYFFGTETGSDFADFLLGISSQYNQSQLQPFLRPQQVHRSLWAR